MFWQVYVSILEEKKKLKFKFQKWPFYSHFWSFFGNYIKIFHKIEIQTVILTCLVCKNLNWIKSYNIRLIKIFFFSYLKMHHFRASLPMLFLTSQKETSSCDFKMAIFSKSFGDIISYIAR